MCHEQEIILKTMNGICTEKGFTCKEDIECFSALNLDLNLEFWTLSASTSDHMA